MPNLPISGLQPGAAVSGTDLFPDVQVVGVGPVKVTADQLKTFMNSSPIFVGQSIFPSGTAAAPSIAHENDVDTGIYFPSTNNVAITTNGAQRLVVGPTGYVGINNTSPAAMLDVVAPTATYPAFFKSDNQYWVSAYSNASLSSQAGFQAVTNDAFGVQGTFIFSANSNAGSIGTSTANGINIYTNNNVKIAISAPGNVTIGQTANATSGAGLTLNSASNYFGIDLKYQGTSIASFTQEATGETYLSANNQGAGSAGLNIRIGGVTRLKVTASGAVGTSTSTTAFAIGQNGSTNPTFLVDDSASSSATGVKITSAAASAGAYIAAISSGTNENLLIDAKGSGTLYLNDISTGAVCVGASSAVQKFNVYGGINVQSAATLGTSTAPSTWSYEYPVSRFYVGDGSGYSWAFSKRSASTTIDIVTISDANNSLTIGEQGATGVQGALVLANTAAGAVPTTIVSSNLTTQAVIYTLPTAAPGVSGYVLASTTGGVMSWVNNDTGIIINSTSITGGSNNNLLYDNAGTVGEITTANTSALVTSASGVPSYTSGSTANRVLRTNGTAITFAQVDLSTDVTGLLPLANGGTNANLTASNGGIFYSTATAGAILAGTSTAGQILRSGASSAPSWSTATFPSTATSTGTILRADGTNWVATTATYPTTTTINQLLYSSAADTISGLATVNGGILNAGATGVPALTVTPVLGVAGTSAGTIGLSGATSGVVTLQTAAAAGTWSLTLPTGVPAGNGYVLTSTTAGVTSWSSPTSLGIDLDVGTTSITNGTAGRILFEGAGNVLQESANLTFATSTLTIGVATSATGSLALTGSTSGTATITAQSTAGTPTLTLPNTSGTLVSTASAPLSINATTGAISITGADGQVLAGSTPAFTATPTLGVAGTSSGSLTIANSTNATHTNILANGGGAGILQLGGADASSATAQTIQAQSSTGASTTGPTLSIIGSGGTSAGGKIFIKTKATTAATTAIAIDSAQNVGIGTESPSYLLDIQKTQTSVNTYTAVTTTAFSASTTLGVFYATNNISTFYPTGGTNSVINATYQSYFGPQGGNIGSYTNFNASFATAGASPSGTVAAIVGFKIGENGYFHSGTASIAITGQYGLSIANQGSVTTGITKTNAFGLYINDQTGATNNYAIYSEGGQSVHAGNIRFGSTVSPTATVDITGTLAVSTAIGTSSGGTGLSSFTANGLVYASSTSALTTGSVVTYDGTTFKVTGKASYLDPALSTGGANIVASYSYNDNNANSIGSNYQTGYYVIYVSSSAGITAIPSYSNAGAGVGYAISIFDPDAGTFTYGTTGVTINFTQAGTGGNTFDLVFNQNTGAMTIQRTSGAQSYTVYVQRWSAT